MKDGTTAVTAENRKDSNGNGEHPATPTSPVVTSASSSLGGSFRESGKFF
jgi:hypothetical protein